MPPKPKAVVGNVDGVSYSHNLASGIVVVGTGIISNDRRDTFKLKADSTLESQIRARPQFKELAAIACAAAAEQQQASDTAAAPQPLQAWHCSREVDAVEAEKVPDKRYTCAWWKHGHHLLAAIVHVTA